MKVIKSSKKNNTVSLEIEASQETIEEGLSIVFKNLVKSANIPGFRKGKAPRHVFEKHYGKEILIKDGVSEAINIAYLKAIESENLTVVDYPKNIKVNEYKKDEPLQFTCEVDVKPEIKVSKYKKIAVDTESPDISESLIDAQINQLLSTHVSYNLVDRPVESEDLLKVNTQAFIDNEPFDRWTKNNVGVGVGSSIFSEKFDSNLIGKKAKEPITFSVDYDADYYLKDVAGKTVTFNVEILEVKGKSLPELTDDFVKEHAQCNNADELRSKIRTSLEEKRKKDIDESLKESIIASIAEKNTFDIPEGMIKYEVDQDLRYYNQTLKQSGSNLENYLKMVNQTEETFTGQLREGAEKRVKTQLIIESIIRQESIEASHQEILAELKQLKPEIDSDEKAEETLKTLNKDGISQMICQRKAFDFLIEHAKISTKESK